MTSYGGDFGNAELGRKVLIEYPLHITKVENECFLALFVGMPGRGKTFAATRLAEQLDDTFDIDRVCVTYQEFLRQLNILANAWENHEDVAGRVVIFDEFQRSASARKWMTSVNMAITDVLHTFRYLNLIVIFTTPHLSFIDVNARAVMHMNVTMKEKRPEMGLSRGELSFSEIKNSPSDPSDKLYHYAPRVFTPNGAVRVGSVWFEKPSARMQKLVNAKVNAFKHSVLTDSIERTDRQELEATQKEKTAAQKTREMANEVFVKQERYYDSVRRKWDRGAVLLDYPELTNSKFNELKPILNAMIKFGVKPGDIEMP